MFALYFSGSKFDSCYQKSERSSLSPVDEQYWLFETVGHLNSYQDIPETERLFFRWYNCP